MYPSRCIIFGIRNGGLLIENVKIDFGYFEMRKFRVPIFELRLTPVECWLVDILFYFNSECHQLTE